MAWLERKERADGGSCYMVRWRLGGTRRAPARPRRSVPAATSRTAPGPRASSRWSWPPARTGRRLGQGPGLRPGAGGLNPMVPLPMFADLGEAYVRQIVDRSPGQRTAPKRSRIRQSQADLRFLTEAELAQVAEAAGVNAGMLTVTVGTGMRFGEVTALWVSDVDLRHRTVRINKAWKRDGEDNEQDTPSWLKRALGRKHKMPRPSPGQPQHAPLETPHRRLRRARQHPPVPGRGQGCGRPRLHDTHRPPPAQRGLLRTRLASADGRPQ